MKLTLAQHQEQNLKTYFDPAAWILLTKMEAHERETQKLMDEIRGAVRFIEAWKA